jgi:hypothetical protein
MAMRKPDGYSDERWDQLSDQERIVFWEAWAAALDSIAGQVDGDALGTVTASIAAAREAANEYRARLQGA